RPPAPRPAWRTVLATVTGNLFLVLGSAILGTLSILLSWVPPRGNWVFAFAKIWSALLLRASWLDVHVRREGEIDPRTSYVYLANHQSLFDIPVLLSTVPGQVRMMAKRSLFRIPIFGWALSAGGFIPIDRGDRSTARQSFAAAMQRLRGGISILLFPEGTRSLTDTLLPFQRGGFLLALKLGLPIVPVGIRGTRDVQRKGNWAIRPGPVVVSYGAPIPVADYGLRRKGELVEEVRRRIAELAGIELAGEKGGESGGTI
ncbi:MAG TPA: lysophospholipid acyltransferase family protein, partial [Thermoanaerobaculia bacterium]|nr:lysophospholipid acyltransferase family protein [Thermoanaerobaculia bacterium]